jgi:hypothetical protein
MVDKDVMVLQNYTNSEKDVLGPRDETYPAFDDANQAENKKVEEASYAEEEEDPVPMIFPKIKGEAEVSCMSVCPLLGRQNRYAEIPVVLLISISLCTQSDSRRLTGFEELSEISVDNCTLLNVACDILLPFSFKKI